ncbi:MAG: SRPBCC domain-containing protein [Bacteroidia bacterium]|nr:SRPBCC domain-containing protein [Bacteroidia bacterium]
MKNQSILIKSVKLNVSVSKVWEALTTPELVKQYFFGTEITTDWKKGSTISYRGVWEGKPYEDKGNILEIETEKLIRYNYWSSFSGKEDIPSNYANISYELARDNDFTILTVTQDGFANNEAMKHSEQNWGMVMESLKKLVEAEETFDNVM